MGEGLARNHRSDIETESSTLRVPEMASREQLQELLGHAYRTIGWMIENLREGKDQIERTAVRKLHATDEKLHAVSSTTETAATDMLDGLDRALGLMDRIEAEVQSSAGVISELRDEIYGVMNHLQFQDITTQQLSHASSILHEMEVHLSDFVHVFDVPEEPFRRAPEAERARGGRAIFDPAATLDGADDRQAMVDQLLGLRR